jgi:hypothetical protein
VLYRVNDLASLEQILSSRPIYLVRYQSLPYRLEGQNFHEEITSRVEDGLSLRAQSLFRAMSVLGEAMFRLSVEAEPTLNRVCA